MNYFGNSEIENILKLETSSQENEEIKSDIIDIKLEEWKTNQEKIKLIFSNTYKEFKNTELKLLKIKEKIKLLSEWTEKTEHLFKQDDSMNEIIQQKIKDKMNEFNCSDIIQKYKHLKNKLNDMTNYLHGNLEIETLSKCPVCITNIKNVFFIPCGHTICQKCVETQQKINKKIICPVCRKESYKIGKLFN